MPKYKYILQRKYTEANLSNGTRKLLRFEITKMLIAVKKNKFSVSFIIIFGLLSFPIWPADAAAVQRTVDNISPFESWVKMPRGRLMYLSTSDYVTYIATSQLVVQHDLHSLQS